MKASCLVATLLLLGGCGHSDYPPVEILHARMGFFDDSRDGRFVRSTAIPLRDGLRYGWAIALRTNKEKVAFTERLSLAGPTTWGMANSSVKYEVTPDRRSITVHRETAVRDGMIYSIWVVSPSDPAGTAAFNILIEGKVAQSFNFELKK